MPLFPRHLPLVCRSRRDLVPFSGLSLTISPVGNKLPTIFCLRPSHNYGLASVYLLHRVVVKARPAHNLRFKS